MDLKRLHGQYFTASNPFNLKPFQEFANLSKLDRVRILEPFAGSNNLIHMLKDLNLCNRFDSFDIAPHSYEVKPRDTLFDFPTGYDVCITNPPYLAKNSAKRRGFKFDAGGHDDLYKFALEKCLENCRFVGAIVPASFLQSGLFRNRLLYYVMLNSEMFKDTEHPTCLALFAPFIYDTKVYEQNKFIGLLSELEEKIPDPQNDVEVKFNAPNGNLGLIAIDNTKEASIRFCKGNEIASSKILHSSRSVTRIKVKTSNTVRLVDDLNEALDEFRLETGDIFLTPFKGIRKDGKFRRRLDFNLAKKFICNAL